MKFKIPFTFASLDKLKKKSLSYKNLFKHKRSSKLQEFLDNTDSGLTREEYLAICVRGFVNRFIVSIILLTAALFFLNINYFYLFSLGGSLLLSGFVLFSQLTYVRVYNSRKQKEIEKNLIPALEDMLVQLNSGIPLFSILVNISSSDYGALSDEFKRIVRKINSGFPQVEVLEDIGDRNPSIYFRRALWQISNGMRSGSDIGIIIRESVKSLGEEQILQIQNYGNKLNPLIMFYMLITVIMPALAITFLTVITSLVNLPSTLSMILFVGLGVFVIFIQIMFLGSIKSMRPSLI
jgi:flagellar protein FlaJ